MAALRHALPQHNPFKIQHQEIETSIALTTKERDTTPYATECLRLTRSLEELQAKRMAIPGISRIVLIV